MRGWLLPWSRICSSFLSSNAACWPQTSIHGFPSAVNGCIFLRDIISVIPPWRSKTSCSHYCDSLQMIMDNVPVSKSKTAQQKQPCLLKETNRLNLIWRKQHWVAYIYIYIYFLHCKQNSLKGVKCGTFAKENPRREGSSCSFVCFLLGTVKAGDGGASLMHRKWPLQ